MGLLPVAAEDGEPHVMGFTEWVSLSAQFFEGAGVLVMVLGSVLAIGGAILPGQASMAGRYRRLRERIGAAILLGLELLVAADIIRTIAERPTLNQVVVLGGVVLIRTFLSFTLAVELEGRWPWQRGKLKAEEGRRAPATPLDETAEDREEQPPSVN